MIIGGINQASIANAVWTNASRALLTDPATDAGAATLVWAHAARALTADPATDAGAATLVWAHSGRGITSIQAAGIAVAVKAASLANATTVDLRPAASRFRDMCIFVQNGAGITIAMALYDGTTFNSHGVSGGTSELAPFVMKGWSTYGPALNNTGTTSGTYSMAGVDWT